ncbi:MAG: hypothetical protein AABZ60_16670 [Planctomycetota bacterium]
MVQTSAKVNPLFLAIALFFSGVTSLSFEGLWFRQLGLLLGSSHLASAFLLSVLMFGFASGAFWAPKFCRYSPYPLRWYGGLELFIGIYTLLAFLLLQMLPLDIRYSLRFWLGLLILLPPTIAMGATLPILCDSLFAETPRQSSRLYAINTFGAVCGITLSGFVFQPIWGMTLSVFVTSFVCIVLGLLIFFLGKSVSCPPLTAHYSPFPWRFGAFYFGLGFVALAYQNFWTRALILVLGSSVYAFSIVLLTFLLATALGSLVASFFSFRQKTVLGYLQIAGSFFGFLSIFYLTALPDLFFRYFEVFGPKYLYIGQFVFCFLLMAPTCFILGATFPMVLSLTPPGRNVSLLYMANTLGGALAPFLLGILLLYFFTIHQALLFTVSLQFLLGISWFSGRVRLISLLLPLLLVVLTGIPEWDPQAMTSANYLYVQVRRSRSDYLKQWEQIAYQEGVRGIVTVDQKRNQTDFTKVLRINGKDASGYADLPTEILLAHLPFAFHPNPKTALVIGFGGGITVGSVLLHPLEKVYCAELIQEVFQMEPFFQEINHSPLKKNLLHCIAEDGRTVLASLQHPLDLIISQPSNPWISGAASLFTKEFYEVGSQKLAEDGVFCQWLQTYEISWTSLGTLLKAFREVFPVMYIYHPHQKADILLIGLKKTSPFLPERLFQKDEVKKDLKRASIHTEADLINSFLLVPGFPSKYLDEFPIKSDDNGYVEFHTPYELFTSNYLDNNRKLRRLRTPLSPLKNASISYESLSNQALQNGDMELSTYWTLLAIQEKEEPWIEPRFSYLFSSGVFKTFPLYWNAEVGPIAQSYQFRFEAEKRISQGQWKEARQELEKSIACWELHREAHLRLGTLLDYQRHIYPEFLKPAFHHFKRVRALGGETPQILEKIEQLCRNLLFEMYNQKNWIEVYSYSKEYEGIQPRDESLQNFFCEALEQLAIQAFEEKQWEKTIAYLTQLEANRKELSLPLKTLYQEAWKQWLQSK